MAAVWVRVKLVGWLIVYGLGIYVVFVLVVRRRRGNNSLVAVDYVKYFLRELLTLPCS